MCAITGSFDLNFLKENYYKQLERGNLSSSFSVYNTQTKTVKILFKDKKQLPDHLFEAEYNPGDYFITHSQAPTGNTNHTVNIHPSEHNYLYNKTSYFWHNGIITDYSLRAMNKRLGTDYIWDTRCLQHYILAQEDLSQVDGQFAGILIDPDGGLDIVRNEIAPLYIEGNVNLCSIQFENSVEVPSNVLWRVEFKTTSLIPIMVFNSYKPLYYFGEDNV